MRTFLLVGWFAFLAAASCAAQPAPDTQSTQTPPSQPPPGQLVTPARDGTKDVTHAAEAPLHDINLTRQKVPSVLLAAIADPYLAPTPATCRNLDDLVSELNGALGADFDQPETPQDPSLTHKSHSIGLSLAHGVAESLLPYAGFVRTLSGAERHDQLVGEAITAGSVRRGYLKGLGEAHNCPTPARPHHLTTPRRVPDMAAKPEYPIQ